MVNEPNYLENIQNNLKFFELCAQEEIHAKKKSLKISEANKIKSYSDYMINACIFLIVCV